MRPFLGGHRVAADKSAGGRAEEGSGSGIWNKINVSDVNYGFFVFEDCVLGSNFYSKSTHEYKCNSAHFVSVKSVKSTLHFCVVFPKTIACHIRPNDHSAQMECNRYNIINYNILPTKGSEQNTHTHALAHTKHKTGARMRLYVIINIIIGKFVGSSRSGDHDMRFAPAIRSCSITLNFGTYAPRARDLSQVTRPQRRMCAR